MLHQATGHILRPRNLRAHSNIPQHGCVVARQVLSASSAGCRVWNPRTGACIHAIECGYGLCAVWAPGNRHVVVGTKVSVTGLTVNPLLGWHCMSVQAMVA